jgi:Asp-tRNA(Asn)/Glu-tRNA(Gln) amidotransferase A subunit family amidase
LEGGREHLTLQDRPSLRGWRVKLTTPQLPMSRFTWLANYLDLTAASLPLWQVNDLPAGAQFVMQRDQDARLLAFLTAAEGIKPRLSERAMA